MDEDNFDMESKDANQQIQKDKDESKFHPNIMYNRIITPTIFTLLKAAALPANPACARAAWLNSRKIPEQLFLQ